jgi:two-component system cell cycle sensor histidine kinase/response regulator CckA
LRNQAAPYLEPWGGRANIRALAAYAPPDWYTRLARALAVDDPAAARDQALALLAEIREADARMQERLEMLSSASFEGIMVHVDNDVIHVNQRLCEMIGYKREEILGPETLLRLALAPDDQAAALQRVASQAEGAYLVTGIRKDGTRFRAEIHAKQGKLGNRPVRVVAVRDVTAREQTQALLRESEQRFRDLARATFDFTVFTRNGGVVIDVDGDTTPVLGRPAEELIGRSVLDFTAPSAFPLVQQQLEDHALGSYEAAALHTGGEVVPVQVTVAATTLNGQPVRAAALRDLRPMRRLEAERRALEQRLERAQRLDSLGILAGGIAHDFNNLLVGVLGNAELLRDGLSGEQQEMADEIFKAAQRAAALIRQMLAYAGQRDYVQREPVDIGALVRELRALLGATLSKKAHLELAIEPGSVVLGERATLTQVLMNLLTNASDALGDRAGLIEVRARPVTTVDGRWDAALGATVSPGSWVLIEVKDDGIGMDEATRSRVFEPFFSTKERGHGLGLAACLGIVSTHGGAVLVESELGYGSCFSLLLPASSGAPPTKDRPVVGRTLQHRRVLIIDDEALVRTQLRRTLELRGYTVQESVDGRSGLAAALETEPDVVILDMTMPDLDGAEVLTRLRAAGSRTPVIISSGYLDSSLERRLPRGEFQGFLNKPYAASDLATAIERALAHR